MTYICYEDASYMANDCLCCVCECVCGIANRITCFNIYARTKHRLTHHGFCVERFKYLLCACNKGLSVTNQNECSTVYACVNFEPQLAAKATLSSLIPRNCLYECANARKEPKQKCKQAQLHTSV